MGWMYVLKDKKRWYGVDREENFDPRVIHAIETVVIEWSHELHEVLRHNSFEIVPDATCSFPFIEFTFWENRCRSLAGIYQQVS